MSDFYARLKQSIIDRGLSDAGERDEVYAEARRAMIRRLWAHQPALADADIDQRIGAFDTAVERVEADLMETFGPAGTDSEMEGEAAAETDARTRDGTEAEAGAETDAATADEADLAYAVDDRDEDGELLEVAEASPDTAPGETWDDYYDDDETIYDTWDEAGDDGYRPMAQRAGETPPAADEEPVAEASWRRRLNRWSEAPADRLHTRLPPAQRRGGRTLSDQDKIRVLLGAIGALSAILVGLIVYMTLPAGDDGVTLPIEVRREVSDAATAARIAGEQLDVRQSFVLFDGSDPTLFETTPDNPVRLDSDADGAFARVATATSAAGVKAVIGPGLAAQLAGQRVRVTITARSSHQRGAATMRFAYQSGLAISHWQTANLAAGYGDVALIWRLPVMRTSTTGGDYLLIEPGIPGDGTGVDVAAIRIDLLAGPES